MKRRILSVALSLLLVFSLVPMAAFADDSVNKYNPAAALPDKGLVSDTVSSRIYSDKNGDLPAYCVQAAIGDDEQDAAPGELLGTPAIRLFKADGTLSSVLADRVQLDNTDSMILSERKAELVGGIAKVDFDNDISNLEELKALFENGGSGRLTRDITADGTLTVAKDTALSLNGCVLNLDFAGDIFVAPEVSFELYDSGENAHYFEMTNGGYLEWVPAETEDSETVTGGIICNGIGQAGGAVFVEGGSFTMHGGTLVGNIAAYYGGAVYARGGSFTMLGGTLYSNGAAYGGAIMIDNGKFVMQNGVIYRNLANYGGAAFVNNTASTFIMMDGEISGNDAIQGGAVQINNGTFTMNGGTLNGNTANYGGSVINFGKFIMNGGEITSCTASVSGGAVYNEGEFTLTGGDINGNNAKYGGAVVDVNGGIFTMQNGAIECNRASTGGAVYVKEAAFTMENGKICASYSAGDGAVMVASGSFTLNGGEICDNVGPFGGGVINLDGFTMNGGKIYGNYAATSGGGVYNQGEFKMYDGKIYLNEATYGGGMFTEKGDSAIFGGSIYRNNALLGGGIFVQDGNFTMDDGEEDDKVNNTEGGSINRNTAANSGGGVILYKGAFNLEKGVISENSAFYGGGVETETGVFNMTGGIISGNDAYFGGGILNYGEFICENGEITGNKGTCAAAIYSVGETSLTASEGKQIIITGNIAEGTDSEYYESVYTTLIGDRLNLSGKVIIKDNTAENGISNLSAPDAIKVTGALTDSEIYISHVDILDDVYDLGVLTEGFAEFNPGAKAEDFFVYDGAEDMGIILNGDGEIEVVGMETLLALKKEEAIEAIRSIVPENTADEVKAAAEKAIESITKAETLDEIDEIKAAATEEIESLKTDICKYCGKIHSNDFFGKIVAFFHRFFEQIRNLFV